MRFTFDLGEKDSPILAMVGRCTFCETVLIRREWDVRQPQPANLIGRQGDEDRDLFVAHLRCCTRVPERIRDKMLTIFGGKGHGQQT